MLTLAASLTAHQKLLIGRRPAPLITALATRANVPILRWTRYYTGAENDGPHGAAVAADDSLIRARVDDSTIQVSRVASPGSGSTYSSWTNLATIAAGSFVAVAAGTSELTLVCGDNLALKVWHSTDNGASWTGPTTRVTEGSPIGPVAVACKTNGDLCLFYVLGTSTTLKRLRRAAAVWEGAGTNWSKSASVATLTGVAAAHDGADFVLVITGTEVTTTHRKAWPVIMGDGGFPANTWTAFGELATSDAASTTTFHGPAILGLPGYRCTFAHRETGNVAFNRALTSYTTSAFANGTFIEPEPHEASSQHGLALARRVATAVWGTSPAGVWFATEVPSATIDARALSCRYTIAPTSSRLELVLDNHDGLMAALPNASFPSLMVGGELAVQLGYLSGAGGAPEYGVTTRWNVEQLRYRLIKGSATCVIEASGPWETATRLPTTQSWQTAAGTLSRLQIFTRLAARAGIKATSSGAAGENPTGDWATNTPGFTINPGEAFAGALQRLAAVQPDPIRTEDNNLLIVGLTPADATDAALGGAGEHPILDLDLLDAPPAANWQRLQGPDRYADAVTLASVYQHGPRLHILRNFDAATNTRASTWAAAALRRSTWSDATGLLTMPLHAGLQIYDVVSLTTAAFGLAAQKHRVLAIGLDWRRGPAGSRFDSILTLGAL